MAKTDRSHGKPRAPNSKPEGKLKELKALNHYFETIIKNISQAILFIDLSGLVKTYNGAAEKVLKIPSKQVLFQNFWENFNDRAFGFSMREALSSKESPGISYAAMDREEGSIELEIETTLVNENDKNGIHGLILLIRDITDIRNLQILAARNGRMKELGEMVAMVAHEVRNPLGGIKGFASLLERDLKDRPDLQTMAHHIVEGTDHLSHLVSTVLNYAKPLKPEIEWVELNEMIQGLCQHVQADPKLNQGITIEIKSSEKNLTVPIDPALIRSALLNLIVNGIQAMPKGGILSLSLRTSNRYAIISVADTGIGIPKENLTKLYTPFFTTKPEGNGFGLPEVVKILRAHGGEIEVDSQVGIGTCFTVKLPLKPLFAF